MNQPITQRLDTALERAAGLNGAIDYSRLKHFGANPIYWLFGCEIEFEIDCIPGPTQFLEQERSRIAQLIQKKMETTATANPLLEAQLKELPGYTLRDIIMFEIHERLEGIVQKKYSKKPHSIGYYDSERVSELQTKVSSAAGTIDAYYRSLEVIHDVVEEYRKRLVEECGHHYCLELKHTGVHLNFSPNVIVDRKYENALKQSGANADEITQRALAEQKLVNLAGMQTRSMQEFMRHSMSGIMQAYEDAVTLDKPDVNEKKWFRIGAGVSREGAFRFCKNRVEFRGLLASSHIESHLLRIVKGAEYGLSHSDAELHALNVPRLRPIIAHKFVNPPGTEEDPYGEAFYIKRILQSAYEDGSGYLIVEPGYLSTRRDLIAMELFDYGYSDLDKQKSNPITADILREIFSLVHVNEDGTLNTTDVKPYLQWIKHEYIKEPQIDFALKQLSLITSKGTYPSFYNHGRYLEIGPSYHAQNIERMKNSGVLKQVYGDELLQQLASVIPAVSSSVTSRIAPNAPGGMAAGI
ncbi:MAG: hypothetical protein SFT92_08495 [Rickettsiales bacterium]|nr:hypothetical protein [Rickettsiales bacterium]